MKNMGLCPYISDFLAVWEIFEILSWDVKKFDSPPTIFSMTCNYFRKNNFRSEAKLKWTRCKMIKIERQNLTPKCCIFWPAFGCCTLQTLEESCFFYIFRAKKYEKGSKRARNWQKQHVVDMFRKFVHTNLPQAGFELGPLGPQAGVLPTEPPLLVIAPGLVCKVRYQLKVINYM